MTADGLAGLIARKTVLSVYTRVQHLTTLMRRHRILDSGYSRHSRITFISHRNCIIVGEMHFITALNQDYRINTIGGYTW